MTLMERTRKVFGSHYFKIFFVYLLCQGLLLVISGCWWDDWTFQTKDLSIFYRIAIESGRPEWYLLLPWCWNSANNGRILIFIFYLFDAVLVYRILVKTSFFSKTDALWITLLYLSVPVNDARLLISNFSYTVGLFLFLLSADLFLSWKKMADTKKKMLLRIPLLLLCFTSFILNSILVFYYTLFLYIFIDEFILCKENSIFKRLFIAVKNGLSKYPDFFIIPFVYFVINKKLFPTGGYFVSYNSVTVSGMVGAIVRFPLIMLEGIRDIGLNYIYGLKFPSLVFGVLITILLITIFKSEKTGERKNIGVYVAVFGILALAAGMFPYAVVRGKALDTTAVGGRDSMLMPLGIALIIYGIISGFREKEKTIIWSLIVALGICHFGSWYISYQNDYYNQLALMNHLNNEMIENNNLFYLIDSSETRIKGERFYSVNCLSYNVYNDESRLYITRPSELFLLYENEATEIYSAYLFGMKDYDNSETEIDAILIYDGPVPLQDTFALRWYENADSEKFTSMINQYGTMEIADIDAETSKLIITGNRNGEIRNDDDILVLAGIN